LRIQVNGQPREIADNLDLSQLIASLNLKPEQIAIELNQTVVRRVQWHSTILREDDKVEIVHFVGGGCEPGGRCSRQL
jgi:sulfur carrier protein